MSSLFDLPFEDEPEASARHDAAAEPSVHERRRTIYTVSELTAGIRHLLETAYVMCGWKAKFPIAACGTPGTSISR